MGKPRKSKNKGETSAAASASTPTPAKKIRKRGKNKNGEAETSEAPEPSNAVVPANTSEQKKGRNEKEGGQERSSGFIFMCSGKTKPECYRYRVFGLPKGKIDIVEKVKPGARLFLYDFDLKLLYGVYRATSSGGLNLVREAFHGGFPAQVKFKIDQDCLPLPESSFKQAILDNYNSKNKFTPVLSSKQVRKLLALFHPINLVPQPAPPQIAESRHLESPLYAPPRGDQYRSGHVTHAPPPIDSRYIPSAVPPPASDPYVPAAHYVRAPPSIDPRVPPLASDPYVPAAHFVRGPPAIDPRVPPPALPSLSEIYYPAPPNDPYYHLEAVRAYYPENSVLPERVGYRVVPEVIPRDPLPAPARDYRTITGRVGEIVSRVDQLYHAEPVVSHVTAEFAPQSYGLAAAYEDPYHSHADSLQRPVSHRSSVTNVPVSSLYSFAGANPSYR